MRDYKQLIAQCIERGKINLASPYPPDMKGQIGADEITAEAVKANESPDTILSGCMKGMEIIGEKFSTQKAYVPELLMAAKAMSAAMEHLKPFFDSGTVKTMGTLIVGTVAGDLHDIGKNLVSMVVKGGGWKIVDLGVDVSAEKFLKAANEYPGAVIGLSALLTTTMVNMERIITYLRENNFKGKIIVGGAPVTQEFADKIGADSYGKDPQAAQQFLDKVMQSVTE